MVTVSGGQDVEPPDPGDVNGDGNVNVADAILALKIVCGLDTAGENIAVGADVNGDEKIGMAEVIYICLSNKMIVN